MLTKVSGTFAQHQACYKRYADKNVGSLPAFRVGQMVYVNQPSLTTFSAAHQTSARYRKLMPCRTGPFKVLELRDRILTIVENDIVNCIAIVRATSVGSENRHCLIQAEKKRRPATNLYRNDEMDLSSTRLYAILKRQTDYSTKFGSMAMKPRMTPSNSHPIYHITLSHDTGAVKNDNQASLSGSYSSYTQYTYNCIVEKETKKTKSEALAVGFALCIR